MMCKGLYDYATIPTSVVVGARLINNQGGACTVVEMKSTWDGPASVKLFSEGTGETLDWPPLSEISTTNLRLIPEELPVTS